MLWRVWLKALSLQGLTVLQLQDVVMINGCFNGAAFTLWCHYGNIMFEKTVINIHYNCKLLSWMLMDRVSMAAQASLHPHPHPAWATIVQHISRGINVGVPNRILLYSFLINLVLWGVQIKIQQHKQPYFHMVRSAVWNGKDHLLWLTGVRCTCYVVVS